ncbi:efflux RND transporter periplasmic adaptor subunit [Aquirufa sp. ROCK2-A2]
MTHSTHSFFVVLIVFGILSCTKEKQVAQQSLAHQEQIPVTIQPLNTSSANSSVEASGQFSTDDETFLGFKIGGIVQHVFVKEGDAVKAGQLLATLNLTEIKSQVQQAQIGLEKAKRDFQRASNLYRDSVATLEQFQNAKTAFDIAQQQINQLNFNRDFAEIRANKSGFVLRKLANDGQVVGPGTPIVQVNGASSANWILKVALSDRDWASVKMGDAADVLVESFSNKSFSGKVVKKSEGVDPVTGTLWVNISANNIPRNHLASGLFGKAQIRLKTNQSTWKVPYDALMDGDDEEGFLFISNDLKTAQKVKVTLGKLENGQINVLSGLENAKYVITSGNAYLDDQSAIKVISPLAK